MKLKRKREQGAGNQDPQRKRQKRYNIYQNIEYWNFNTEQVFYAHQVMTIQRKEF